jgi:hypothetical protein
MGGTTSFSAVDGERMMRHVLKRDFNQILSEMRLLVRLTIEIEQN